MPALCLVLLALVTFASEWLGIPWWELTRVPPLALLPAELAGAQAGARVVVLAGLGGLCWVAAGLLLDAVAMLVPLPQEPVWAGRERLLRRITRPVPERIPRMFAVLLAAALVAPPAALVVAGPDPDVVLPGVLAALLGAGAFAALRPPEETYPLPAALEPSLDLTPAAPPAAIPWGSDWIGAGDGVPLPAEDTGPFSWTGEPEEGQAPL